jgi:hypothetical protein
MIEVDKVFRVSEGREQWLLSASNSQHLDADKIF